MSTKERYESAKAIFAARGIDAEKALAKLSATAISVNCWQGDDIAGFENTGEALSGGIQATGNYPGKARNKQELMADFAQALKYIGGKKKLNLHANYAITGGRKVERDELLPEYFDEWIAYAKEHQLGLDFNSTYFSHPMVKDNMTLAHPDPAVRDFWVRHGIACRRIAAHMAAELGEEVVHNTWIPDGMKDVPGDRLGPRARLKDSLDRIFAEKQAGVIDSVESKVFGIGLESYTVGSSEFYLSYAARRDDVCVLLDAGHYHPLEYISDKLPALLLFFDKIPLHVTRPVRWDSDHVVAYDDEIRNIATEIVRCDALDKVLVGLDFFDASINRIAAWVIGTRNMQKALLYALLQPHERLKKYQDEAKFTELLQETEEAKLLPYGDIWEHWCETQGVPGDFGWFKDLKAYEAKVLQERV